MTQTPKDDVKKKWKLNLRQVQYIRQQTAQGILSIINVHIKDLEKDMDELEKVNSNLSNLALIQCRAIWRELCLVEKELKQKYLGDK